MGLQLLILSVDSELTDFGPFPYGIGLRQHVFSLLHSKRPDAEHRSDVVRRELSCFWSFRMRADHLIQQVAQFLVVDVRAGYANAGEFLNQLAFIRTASMACQSDHLSRALAYRRV